MAKSGRRAAVDLLRKGILGKAKLTFTNNKKATDTIVSRDYREGFAPPKVG